MKANISFLVILIAWLLAGGIMTAEAQALDIRCAKDGMLLVNRQRTFIIGSYYLPKTAHPYRDLSVNGYNYVRVNAVKSDLDSALRYHLNAWITTGSIKNNSQEDDQKIAGLVNQFKSHPALLCWEMEDEPAFTWNSPNLRISPNQMLQTYQLIKKNDPKHLVITNQAPVNLVSTLQKYTPSTDVVSCDVYPVIPRGIQPEYALYPDGFQGDLLNTYISQVGEYVDKMKKVVNNSKPVFMVLQGFAWEMLRPENQRDSKMILYPTFAESRFMAFDAIVHGATGIIYWGTDFTPQPSEFIDNLNRVTRELSELQQMLAAKSIHFPVETEYHDLRYSVDRGIEFTAKKFQGKTYLITVNADKNPVEITLGKLQQYKTVKVLNEDRTLELLNGKLTDNYKPFDVHIYELSKK